MDEKIKTLTALVKQLQDEKDTVEKRLEKSSQEWEDRLKKLEDNAQATGSIQIISDHYISKLTS